MHIAFFSDQHPGSLGGLQTSLGLQRKHLELRGHTVTTCAPRSRRAPSDQYTRDGDVLISAAQVGEQSFTVAGVRFDRAIDSAFSEKPAIDCVHIQGDIWGAWNGYRFAARHGLPLVHTMHTNIEAGLPANFPLARVVFRMLYAAQEHFLDTDPIRNIADYTKAFAARADVIIAPSMHFARQLEGYGLEGSIRVLPTGVDDALMKTVRNDVRTPRVRPVFLWPGRISKEKRLTDFLEAFSQAGVDASIHVYGAGNGLAHARRRAEELGIAPRVTFFGAVPHDTVLRAMRDADAVVQSSVGFETQGLTMYESVSVGTPVLVRDGRLGSDLPLHLRHAASDESIGAFATLIRTFVQHLDSGDARDQWSDRFLQSGIAARAEGLYHEARMIHAHRATGSAEMISLAPSPIRA
jgi:1,2-diacylglycerol 3-alpha-glucosyltransferase